MSELTRVQIEAPYLIMIGDIDDATNAKTGFGILHWREECVAGQLRLPGGTVDLGVPDLNLEEAVEAGCRSLVIGVAPAGGQIPEHWWALLEQAAALGLDVVSGLHQRLSDRATLAEAARGSGARLVDIRVPPKGLPVATGRKRSGRRLLTVGTDCAIGKKYAALAITRDMQTAGFDATYRATGQTGIMIAGEGIPLDAVVSDFVAGAAEMLSPDNHPDHWDIVEGQGSLFHPAYSGISLSLLHGSQPDAFVVAHDATRQRVDGWEEFLLPTIDECIRLHVELGRRVNPDVRCVGICVNTSSLDPGDRGPWLEHLSEHTGLPCVDPMRDGCDAIVAFIRSQFGDTP